MLTVEAPYSIHQRFAKYYVNRLNELAAKLDTNDGISFVDAVALLDEDIAQIRQAIEWLNVLSSEDSELARIAINLLTASVPILRLRLTNEEFLVCTKTALKSARQLQDERMVRQCLYQLAQAYRDTAHYDESITYARELLDVSQKTGDSRNQAKALFILGTVDTRLSRPTQARQKLEAGIALLQKIGDRSSIYGTSLVNLANAYSTERLYQPAIPLLQEALGLFREQKDFFRMCYALNNLGNAYTGLERYSEALAVFEEGIEIARAIGHNDTLNSLLGNVGYIELIQGHLDTAQAYLEESIKASKAVGDIYTRLTFSGLLIHITMTAENLSESNRQLCALVTEAFECKMIDVVLQMLTGIAKWHLLIGNPVRSLQLLDFVSARPEIDYECIYCVAQVRQKIAASHPTLKSDVPLEQSLEDIVADSLFMLRTNERADYF